MKLTQGWFEGNYGQSAVAYLGNNGMKLGQQKLRLSPSRTQIGVDVMGNRTPLISLRENEFKSLLDPEKLITDVKQHLSPWITLIEDVRNYGSNLIPRCFSSSERALKDAVVLGILLRQVVAMLDGIAILLSNGASYCANLQMRALFEASVYIDWILAADSENKARYYYVHNLRRKRLWASRTLPGSPESQEFVAGMNKSGVVIKDELSQSAKTQIDEIDRVLSGPKFAEINNEFTKYRNERRKKYDPAWYVPLGQPTLGAIARSLGKYSLYAMLYANASEVMHTSSYDHHVKIAEGRITFQPIRSLEGFENILRFTVGIAFSTFRGMLNEYRPGEVQLFNRKYVEKWRKDFLNFPKIRYEPEVTNI